MVVVGVVVVGVVVIPPNQVTVRVSVRVRVRFWVSVSVRVRVRVWVSVRVKVSETPYDLFHFPGNRIMTSTVHSSVDYSKEDLLIYVY